MLPEWMEAFSAGSSATAPGVPISLGSTRLAALRSMSVAKLSPQLLAPVRLRVSRVSAAGGEKKRPPCPHSWPMTAPPPAPHKATATQRPWEEQKHGLCPATTFHRHLTNNREVEPRAGLEPELQGSMGIVVLSFPASSAQEADQRASGLAETESTAGFDEAMSPSLTVPAPVVHFCWVIEN